MPTYVLMKAFENAPAKYDAAMEFVTLGRISRLKTEIASAVKGEGRRILELGCGAGTLAAQMAGRGAVVLGIDTSESMLEIARERAAAAGVADKVELRRLSVMEIDQLPDRSFDAVVSTLVLSELSEEEIEFVLDRSRQLLVPGGELLIADEVSPPGRTRRVFFRLLRFPFQLATYLITQAQSLPGTGWSRKLFYFAIELPLMLLVFFLVPASSRPLVDIEAMVKRAGFRPTGASDYLGGTLVLVRAEAV